MGKDYHEKDYDDEVYEDDYYEEHYDEEELTDEDFEEGAKRSKHLDEIDEDAEEDLDEENVDDWEDDDVKRVAVSYACDECDYRWDDVVIKRKGDEIEDRDVICPMCGSMNVTLI